MHVQVVGGHIYMWCIYLYTHTHTQKSTCQWRVTKLNRGVTDWVLRNLTFRDWHVGDILEGASRGGAAVVNVWGKGRVEGRAGERREGEGKEGEGKEGEVEGREGRGKSGQRGSWMVMQLQWGFKPTLWTTLILDWFLHPVKVSYWPVIRGPWVRQFWRPSHPKGGS